MARCGPVPRSPAGVRGCVHRSASRRQSSGVRSAFVPLWRSARASAPRCAAVSKHSGEQTHVPRPGCAGPTATVPSLAAAIRHQSVGSAVRRQPTQVRGAAARFAQRSSPVAGATSSLAISSVPSDAAPPRPRRARLRAPRAPLRGRPRARFRYRRPPRSRRPPHPRPTRRRASRLLRATPDRA